MTTPVVTRFLRGSPIGAIDDNLLVSLPSFTRRASVKTTATFLEADYVAGVSSDVDRFMLPDSAVNAYVGYWQPEDELELTLIMTSADPVTNPGFSSLTNQVNRRSQFGEPEPLTVGGVAGYHWVSASEFIPSFLGIPWVFRPLMAQYPPFPRRVAFRPGSESGDFVASDFLAPNLNLVGYGQEVVQDVVIPSDGYEIAVWSPDDRPDIARIDYPAPGGYLDTTFAVAKQSDVVTIDGVDGHVFTRVLSGPTLLQSAFKAAAFYNGIAHFDFILTPG